MAPIFLIGYMATGKTTLGRAFAREMGLQHIDLDFFIEQRFHSSISQIFASKGEGEFRRIEAAMLREIGELEDVVISCGGGTPCYNDNMEYMNSRGLTVCLKASEDVVADRILQAGDKRPIMAGKSRQQVVETLRTQLEIRNPFYAQAKFEFHADHLDSRTEIAVAARNLIELLKLR